ncbi:MAG TPA: hypothetical protein VGJ06_22120 [Candidatus Acidoferrum sp.]
MTETDKLEKTSKTTPAVAPKDIRAATNLFVSQIDSLAETLPLSDLATQRARSAANKEFKKFIEDHAKITEKEGNKITFEIGDSEHLRFQRLVRRLHRFTLSRVLVPRSLFVALVSQFDAHIGELMRQIFKLRPEMLFSSEKQLSYAQLVEFGSIEKVDLR